MHDKTPDQVARDAYIDAMGIPSPWSSCDLDVRRRWDAVASAVRAPLLTEIAARDSKLAAARLKLREIVCTEEPDAGVVLLSYDGPTCIDPETGRSTYKHRYFSPLGDALMTLWAILGDGD